MKKLFENQNGKALRVTARTLQDEIANIFMRFTEQSIKMAEADFDRLMNDPAKTESQAHFFALSKPCYMSVVEAGYHTILLQFLWKQHHLAAKNEGSYHPVESLLDTIAAHDEHNKMALNATEGMSQVIDTMVKAQQLTLLQKHQPHQSGDELTYAGFEYPVSAMDGDLLRRIEHKSKGFVCEAEKAISLSGLTAEQTVFAAYERAFMRMSVMECFRAGFHQMLANPTYNEDLLNGAQIIIDTGKKRMQFLPEILKTLVENGYIEAAE